MMIGMTRAGEMIGGVIEDPAVQMYAAQPQGRLAFSFSNEIVLLPQRKYRDSYRRRDRSLSREPSYRPSNNRWPRGRDEPRRRSRSRGRERDYRSRRDGPRDRADRRRDDSADSKYKSRRDGGHGRTSSRSSPRRSREVSFPFSFSFCLVTGAVSDNAFLDIQAPCPTHGSSNRRRKTSRETSQAGSLETETGSRTGAEGARTGYSR